MSIVKIPFAVVAVFLWIGFVCAISFMEAWLKFRAPGITLPLGLGIGRLVFNALNKVEWVLAISLCVALFLSGEPVFKASSLAFLLPLALLILQTVWLLPVLDARAALQMDGVPLPSSRLHVCYVGMEVAKVLSLFVFGISLFKSPAI
jgi:hypothetical protein